MRFTITAHENMISSVQFLISVEEIKISAGGRARRLRFQHARFLFLISKIGFGGQILFLISKIGFEIKNRIGFPERLVRNPILNLQILFSRLRNSYFGIRIKQVFLGGSPEILCLISKSYFEIKNKLFRIRNFLFCRIVSEIDS